MELIDIEEVIKKLAHQKKLPLSTASRKMGFEKNYLYRKLANKDVEISLLLKLSELYRFNLLVLYQNLLPDEAKYKSTEVHLKRQVEALEKELEKVKEENERLWGRIGG